MEYLISVLIAIIGGLSFLLFRKSKHNTQLKADIDLTRRSERSKIVDEEVSSVQGEVDALSQELEKPTDEADKFWRDYGERSK